MKNETQGKRRPLVHDTVAAELLGLRVGTLRNIRSAGLPGPPYVRLGRAVRYDLDALDKFIQSNTVDPNRRAG